MNTRQRWLALALLATVVAAFWPEREESDQVVEPANRTAQPVRASMPQVAEATASQAAMNKRERISSMQADLFPKQSWVPPPKPYILPPPPPPQPPPLPFKYLGRWMDGGKRTLFLVENDQPLPVQPGQVLSGSWRVDEITERTIVFTYLPLNMQSTLGITP